MTYHTLDELLNTMPGIYRRILEEHQERFKKAAGSSHNHQAWEGGYLDHVTETMNIAVQQYNWMASARPLPFTLVQALEVLFLHDIEKPFAKELRNKVVWECCECGFRDQDSDKVAGHLQSSHGYPEEDSFVGTVMIDAYSKPERKRFRSDFLKSYGIKLSPEQENALAYVEGIPDSEYKPGDRVMGELAAFCHCCDILSARLWHDKGRSNRWK